MANEKNKRHKKRKREAEMNFFSTKASFVSGIVVIITIIKDIIELFCELPPGVITGYLCICLGIFYAVLGTRFLDRVMSTKGVANFGGYLTVVSVVIFVVENSVIKFSTTSGKIETILIVSSIGVVSIIGAIVLLFTRYKD